MAAPVTVIVAYDVKFYEQLPKLFPHNPGMAKLFQSSPELVEVTAKRNSSLQGAYLIMAARALGLDCGPMSGFDHTKVDEEFFTAGKPCFGCDQEFFPEGHVKSNFLQPRIRGFRRAAPAAPTPAVQRGVLAPVAGTAAGRRTLRLALRAARRHDATP